MKTMFWKTWIWENINKHELIILSSYHFFMKKFLTIVKAYWQRSLTYRFTVVAYRVGEIGEVLIVVLMWTAIYRNQQLISGLTLSEMITYILIGSFFHAAIRNFLADIIGRDIKEGTLSMFLVKPMSYFSYVLSREVGRMSLATIMSTASVFVTIFFFKTFIWNFNPLYGAVIFLMVILAFITELLLSYLIGLVAFWTDEVIGLYSTIEKIRKFFSGGYFPINLLPLVFVKISFALPFAYSFFVPAQLYLKKLDLSSGLKGLGVQVVWVMILYGTIKIVWNRGLKKYEGTGI
jgi:ABC-2 type transport system permease protein